MVVRIGRNRQRRVRLLPLDRRSVSLRSILWQELLRRGRLRHREADAALVDDCQSGGRVVQTHDHVGTRRHQHPGVHRPIVFERQPRQVAKLVGALVIHGGTANAARHLGRARDARKHNAIARAGRRPVGFRHGAVFAARHLHPLVLTVRRRRLVLLETKAHVMDDGRYARHDLNRCDPSVLFERRGNCDAFPFHDATGWNGIWRQIDADVRLDLPAADGPLDLGRRSGWIAFGGTVIDPRRDGVNLGLRQRPVVIEVPMAWVRKPGRHRSRDNRRLDGLCPRPGVLEGEHRERPDLTRPVAALAILL